MPRLLDGFCGAGGAAVGFARAGWHVVGIDTEPHPDYPFELIIGDAVELLPPMLDEFDAAHTSPPCPRYSEITPSSRRDEHPDLIPVVREILRSWGGPYVIENVEGAKAHMINPLTLCGSTFGLGVRRHRLFETNVPMFQPECDHASQPRVWGVYGDHGDLSPVTRPNGTSRGNKARDVAHAREVMGIDWMTEWDDLADAVPPAYTEWIGGCLMESLEVRDAAV